MGQVWKARDTRLDRNVAIKFCAKEFSERFEREAHAISALNHPNICTLHDIGPSYLVMEFVGGPTLAERIALGEIPLDDMLLIARQIADALEAAHDQGIIHRDLKPANVKLTTGGQVKVLDFGLAKTEHVAKSSADVLSSPTITTGHTRPGTIVGTAPYMSPEQARGFKVDRRADIWAYGCVLYELLTRKRAFEGESVTDILAAVVRSAPDWSALPEATPAAIRRLLRRCLEKDIKRRLPNIGVARLEIEDAAAPSVAAIDAAPHPPTRRNTLAWLAGAGGLTAGAGLVTVLGSLNREPPQNWKGVMLGGPAPNEHDWQRSTDYSSASALLAFLRGFRSALVGGQRDRRAGRFIAWLGVTASKFYSWRERYGRANEHNGWVPRDFWLKDWEQQAIIGFHLKNPLEGYRRLTFMMLDADVVAVSPSSVWRVLGQAGLLRKWNGKPSKKGTGFEQPPKPHEHWHIDVPISILRARSTIFARCWTASARSSCAGICGRR